jgi:thioredoxin reductase (NADPH)
MLRTDGHDYLDEVAADALFLLIGARPITIGLEGWIPRDEHGFLLTGQDVVADDRDASWKLDRAPHPLESSQPGVFVAGDQRQADLERLRGLAEDGTVRPALDTVYPLDQAADALRHLIAGRTQGKLAIAVNEASAPTT